MTQQVLHCRTIFDTKDLTLDAPSCGFTIEEQGSATTVDTSATDIKIAALWNTTFAPYAAGSLAGTWTLEYYDITAHLDGTPAGSPIHVVTGSFTAHAASIMPEGVSAVLSYRSDYGTDVEFTPGDPHGPRPRARHRNRFYLPPLNTTAFTTDSTTSRTKFATSFMTTMLGGFHNLYNMTSGATHASSVVVWSRAAKSTSDLVDSWMDDRPDYQRRRADQSTSRQHVAWP